MRLEKRNYTERVIQFGAGGFLRGFADWMLQKLNENTDFEGGAVVVKLTDSKIAEGLRAQNCNYTHIVRGEEGYEASIIDVITRCIKADSEFDSYLALASQPELRYVISNTTEAGIVFCENDKISDVPPSTFPAKVTLLLKKRFDLGLGGFIFLPCELIDRNGDNLKKCILKYAELWELGEDFCAWVEKENVFTNTLVDRINTGFPKGENIDLGYEDKMLNASEYFHLWVIETDIDLERELPFKKAGLNVIVTRDGLERYRTRKVRILNGAHTSLVPYALLSGFDTVKSCMDNKDMYSYVRRCIFDEIIPTLDLPKDELVEYAENVLVRFSNPYIKHYLSSIALNSVSKFKVRVLPSILEYKKRFGTYPSTLIFSLARLIEFYKTDMTNDLKEVEDFMRSHSTAEILSNSSLWGEDLTPLLSEVLKYENK